MFYLSRAEQAALIVLVALLLAGAGVLTYAKGQHSAASTADQPIFVPSDSTQDRPILQTGAPSDGYVTGERATGIAAAGIRISEPAPKAQDLTPITHTQLRARKGRAEARQASDRSPGPGAGLISLNAATAKDLEALPGIGPVFAQRIVAYREKRKQQGARGFESKDELLNVPGIGPKRYAAIRSLVTL